MIELLKKINRIKELNIEYDKDFAIYLSPIQSEKDSFSSEDVYKIIVKDYMAKAPTRMFDFHKKWNNSIPMPFTTMSGTVERETTGMYYMNLKVQGIAWQGFIPKSAIISFEKI